MLLKDIKHDFFCLLVGFLVFREYRLPWSTAATSKTHCDKTWEKKLSFGQVFMVPAARKYPLFCG